MTVETDTHVNRYLRAANAARYLGLAPSTLAKMRLPGDGPEFAKSGPRVGIYDTRALDAWLVSRARRPGPIRVTLDTNVVRDSIEPHRRGHQAAQALFRVADEGRVELAVTSRIEADIPVDGPIKEQIARLPALERPQIATVFRVGHSRIGDDQISSADLAREAEQIIGLLFPHTHPGHRQHRSRLNDIDHLLGHKLAGRDVFLTGDGKILAGAAQLKERHGIVVMTPGEFVAEL